MRENTLLMVVGPEMANVNYVHLNIGRERPFSNKLCEIFARLAQAKFYPVEITPFTEWADLYFEMAPTVEQAQQFVTEFIDRGGSNAS